MTTDTPESLLEAVAIDWRDKYGTISCPECGWGRKANKPDISLNHASNCRRPSTRAVQPTYTGPALGSDELDALLLVAGVKKLRESKISTRFSVYDKLGKFWFVGNNPGHALALAIAEARNG